MYIPYVSVCANRAEWDIMENKVSLEHEETRYLHRIVLLDPFYCDHSLAVFA